MRIDRVWAMPNRWTFTIKPIRQLLKEEVDGGPFIDPMAGKYSPADETNDINPDMPTDYHEDALLFLKTQPDNKYYGALFDPPYSYTQAIRKYKNVYKDTQEFMDYIRACKKEVARIVMLNGKVICFGWNSGGLGKSRGFELKRVLLVPHGSGRPDTIVTVEIKIEVI